MSKLLCKMYNNNNWYSLWWRVPIVDSLFYKLHDNLCDNENPLKRKSFLVTVYYRDDNDNFILDENALTPDDYDYELCITKVIDTHLQNVNSDDVAIRDVALTTDPKRIRRITKRME